MRHSKRDYLTCDDIKLAMKTLNVNDIFGYPSYSSPFQYQKMTIANDAEGDKDQVLWYQKPEQIDLKEYVLNQKNT